MHKKIQLYVYTNIFEVGSIFFSFSSIYLIFDSFDV